MAPPSANSLLSDEAIGAALEAWDKHHVVSGRATAMREAILAAQRAAVREAVLETQRAAGVALVPDGARGEDKPVIVTYRKDGDTVTVTGEQGNLLEVHRADGVSLVRGEDEDRPVIVLGSACRDFVSPEAGGKFRVAVGGILKRKLGYVGETPQEFLVPLARRSK